MSLLAVPIFILTILLTTSCGNDNNLTPTNISDAPSNLVATTISRSEIELSWRDNSSDEDGFNIERKEGPWGTFQRIARVGANITTYSDKGSNNLAPDKTYYYRVAYYRGNEVSEYSNVASATTLKKVLSSGKSFPYINPGEVAPLKAETIPEEKKGLSAEEECIQGEDHEGVNGYPCDSPDVTIDVNIASPWINNAVLNSLVNQDIDKTGLRSIPGLTEIQIEEIKSLATSVQMSFLMLHNISAMRPMDSEKDRAIEIDRQANEIVMYADQRLMELLGPDKYAEFMRWAEGVSREKYGTK